MTWPDPDEAFSPVCPPGEIDELEEYLAEAMKDPEFRRAYEAARSLIESADYLVRYRDQGPAITCECCGTTVAKMPERLAADRDGRWKPGIWEPDAGRRHTLRRCEWNRANP